MSRQEKDAATGGLLVEAEGEVLVGGLGGEDKRRGRTMNTLCPVSIKIWSQP